MPETWLPVLSPEEFDQGLRIDKYIASLAQNKEAFRANFVRAIELFTLDELVYFRTLPEPIRIAVLTDDAIPDTFRDVPIVARISVEARSLELRLFRRGDHPAIDAALSPPHLPGAAPVIAFYDKTMRPGPALIERLPEMTRMMAARRAEWIAAHPDVLDATFPPETMSAITRTRLALAASGLSYQEHSQWGRAMAVELRAMAARTLL